MFKKLATTALLLLFGVVVAGGCGGAVKDEVAILETTKGKIVFGFFPDGAPNHVENFKQLARDGVYNNVQFHRVIPGFVIQAGDPLTANPDTPRNEYGTGGTNRTTPLALELNDHKHERGALGMARSQDPNSADSQFYITLETQPHLDRGYTVFGEVLDGMDVVDSIASVQTDGVRGIPLEPVRILSVQIVPRKEAGLQ